jgi:phosphatidylserine/phosphatidylglycerophosphate/cardiolipin synthase-like enzyme
MKLTGSANIDKSSKYDTMRVLPEELVLFLQNPGEIKRADLELCEMLGIPMTKEELEDLKNSKIEDYFKPLGASQVSR